MLLATTQETDWLTKGTWIKTCLQSGIALSWGEQKQHLRKRHVTGENSKSGQVKEFGAMRVYMFMCLFVCLCLRAWERGSVQAWERVSVRACV